MKTRFHILCTLILCILPSFPTALSAQDIKPIKLLKPQTDIGKPLMQVLMARQTSREFNMRPLPLQELSNLLWAA